MHYAFISLNLLGRTFNVPCYILVKANRCGSMVIDTFLVVQAGYDGTVLKLRIPFPRRAQDRKLVPALYFPHSYNSCILISTFCSILISATLFIILFSKLGLYTHTCSLLWG